MYLENQAASIYLGSPKGPHTCFKVFGSPFTPKKGNWAFQYEREEAPRLWDAIPSDADIVITHTPPKGHCDGATKDDRSGCEVLYQALHRVRPLLSVFGHIHEARGVEIVRWNIDSPERGSSEEEVEVWKDPGIGSKKQSLVNLTAKGGRPLDNSAALTRCNANNDLSLASDAPERELGDQSDAGQDVPPSVDKSTSRLEWGVPNNSEAARKAMLGGAIAFRQVAPLSDIGLPATPDVERRTARRETAMVNAALLGPRIAGSAQQVNRPIVVDVGLPVW